MASLKAVQQRMKSVKGIQKITGAMKMVSAAKFKHDEKRMNAGLPFAGASQNWFNQLPDGIEGSGQRCIIAPLASDKGLCGAIQSSIAKETKLQLQEQEKAGNSVELLCVGNKSSGAMKRLFGDRIVGSFEETQKVPFNFGMASQIAERFVNQDADKGFSVSNHFRSMIAYDTTSNKLYTKKEVMAGLEKDRAAWGGFIDKYNFEPGMYEVFDDLVEFYTASAIFGNYLGGVAAEQSARMAAMENASKNCGEIYDKLTLQYNRARQAKITTELCEIISGASAV